MFLLVGVSWSRANPDWSTEAFSITSVITFDPNLAAIFCVSALTEHPAASWSILGRDRIRARQTLYRELNMTTTNDAKLTSTREGNRWRSHSHTNSIASIKSLHTWICNRCIRGKCNLNKNLKDSCTLFYLFPNICIVFMTFWSALHSPDIHEQATGLHT